MCILLSNTHNHDSLARKVQGFRSHKDMNCMAAVVVRRSELKLDASRRRDDELPRMAPETRARRDHTTSAIPIEVGESTLKLGPPYFTN
jgi:hypothetical protein